MATKVKALQTWCQQQTKGYQDVHITNMTTSWRDGLAFCALIHRFRPDLIDFDSLSKENILHNNQVAFNVAETELDIAALLDAEDMVAMKVPDKLSVVTYVSQYYNVLHKLKPTERKIQKRSASPTKEEIKLKRKSVEPSQPPQPPQSQQPQLTEKVQKFSICEICKKKVHLVERFIDEGKIYHRHCHRTQSLSGMYRREGSAVMHNYMENLKSPEPRNEKAGANGHTFNDLEPPSPDRGKLLKKTPTSRNVTAKPYSGHLSGAKVDSNVKEDFPENIRRSTPGSKQNSRPDSGTGQLHKGHDKVDLHEGAKRELTIAGSNNDTNDHLSGSTSTNVTTALSDKRSPTKDVKGTKLSTSPHEEPKEMLPALLKTLADVKQNKMSGETEISTKYNTSPTSVTAPLISELPKVSSNPLPKPRSPRQLQETPVPKTLPRSKQKSLQSNEPVATLEYDDDLNPFASAGANSEANVTTESQKEPSNPFDDCGTEEEETEESGNPFGEEEEIVGPAEDSCTNPFGDTEEDTDPVDSPGRRQTINITGPKDYRLNPFTEEYEKKKLSTTATANDKAPKPPARKKGVAPTPPTPEKKISTVAQKAVASPPLPVSPPERKNKRQAPNWRANMEKKMEEVNATNKTDNRFVDKTERPKALVQKVPLASANMNVTRKQPPARRDPHRPARPPAPGFGFPLVKRKVTSQMTEEEITTEMKVLDLQLKDLEKKGIKLEEVLRDDMELGNDLKPESEQLMSEWFELVHQKNKLVRRETDLVFLMRQQKLEQEHADVEFKIRKLMNKPDSEKTEAEKEDETKLLEQLVKIVERRNTIINSIEESRVKEEKEDAAYDMMKKLQRDSPNDSDGTKKKKKNKVKKMFSKRKKDGKQKTASTQAATPTEK